jgi:hypothetical protein
VLGDHPGNPFRAFADALTVDLIKNFDSTGDGIFDTTDGLLDSGNGIIDPGEALFAQDLTDPAGNAVAGGDGIPDRAITGGTDTCGSNQGCVDSNGDGIADVILAPGDPFDPANGIAFNEDVRNLALRAFGKLGCLQGFKATKIADDCANTGGSEFNTFTARLWDEITYQVPDSSWEITGWGMYELRNTDSKLKNTSQGQLEFGLTGDLVTNPNFPTGTPGGSSDPTYWNPFSTQQLSCTNRVCTDVQATTNTIGADGLPATFINQVDVLDAINISGTNNTREEAFQFQVMGTGDLVQIPTGGMVAAAFGAGYRRVQEDNDINEPNNQCDWHQGGCAFDWIEDQDYYSVFYEFFVPVLDNLDLSLAGSYVDYGGSIGDSFDPKFTIAYRPLDMLSLRGSWSSAFIAPTLFQQFSPGVCFLETSTDEIQGDSVGTFRVSCLEGTPTLQNETATVWNVGASLSLLDGDLSLGVDYATYDFEDRISRQTQNQVLNDDFARFEAAGGDVDIQADVTAWETCTVSPCQTAQIIRDPTGQLNRVDIEFLNASKMEHKAWDFYGRYNLSQFDIFGNFAFALSATYVDEYSYDLGGTTKGDGAGSQNENIAEVPPMPNWRVNGTVNWLYGNNAAVLRVRRISEFDLDTVFGNQGTADAATYVDVQYGYQFTDVLGTGREARLEVGIRNLMDYYPDPINTIGGIETYLHDIRGRIWYGRVNVAL